MQIQGEALRVSIYIGESDQHRGKPLYMALLEFLRKEGASGATVTRGLAGFGAHSRIHTATIVTLSTDLPVKLEWVDLPERVERLLPQVRRMVDDGLITLEEVRVIQYAPGRQEDPLDQPVSQVMRREVTTVSPETPVDQLVTLLLKRGHRSLPVVDAQGHLLGIITDGDLLRRSGEAVRPGLLRRLAGLFTSRGEPSTPLPPSHETAAQLMSAPAITVTPETPLEEALGLMLRHGIKRLPVVDREGRLLGLLGRGSLLQGLLPEGDSERPEPPAP